MFGVAGLIAGISISACKKNFRVARLAGLGVLFIWLAGCQSIEDSLYETAINYERSGADLEASEVVAGDIQFSLLQGGNPQGEVVLMVHGFGGDKDNWLSLSERLSDDYRIIAVDLAGHGDTTFLPGTTPDKRNYKLDNQTQRLKTLLDVMKVDQVHIMGNSMGGAISLMFASYYPEKVKSMTLLANAGVESPEKSDYFKELEQGTNRLIITKPGDYDAFMDYVMVDGPSLPWPVDAVLERRAIARQKINQVVFNDLMISMMESGSADDVNAWLETIYTPTLVVWGEKDRILHVSTVGVIEQHMPNVEAVVLPNTGHLPMLEKPETVSVAFKKFAKAL